MKKIFKTKLLKVENPKTVFEELKPTLTLARIFGFAPFTVTGSRGTLSKWFALQNLFLIALIFFSLYSSDPEEKFAESESPLSILFFKAITLCKVAYAAFCQLNFTFKAKTCLEVWSLIQEINVNLIKTYNPVNFKKNKMRNFYVTSAFAFFVAASIFIYYFLLNVSLSFTFWIILILPSLFNYILIFYFFVFTTSLRYKCRLMNSLLEKEIQVYEMACRNTEERYHFDDETEGEGYQLLRKVRSLKFIHLKMYEAVKNLNILFGFHFLYIFVMYFCLGSLHTVTIFRYMADSSSVSLFVESLYIIVMETAEVIYAVYGSIILETELQSFSMQLHQCSVAFTASGYFTIDFIMFLELVVAFFSNAVFFLQIDNINNSRS